MRIDSSVVASMLNTTRASSTDQGLQQLIDLGIQKQNIRGDASIPEALKPTLIGKLDKISDPIQQGMEADQARKTTEELVEEARRAAEEAKKAGETGQGSGAGPVDGVEAAVPIEAAAAVQEAAPAAPAADSSVGQNIDDYA